MAGSIRHAVIFCAAILCSFSLTAEAARQKPVVRPASATDQFKKGGTTLDIERHWGEVIDVQGGRVNLPVTQASKYNYTRLAGLLKQAINSNPVKYAATAGVTYLLTQLPGASFDPVTGRLVTTGPIQQTGSHWRFLALGQSQYLPGYFSTALDACKSANPNGNPTYRLSNQTQTSAWCYRTVYGNEDHIGYAQRITYNCPNGYNQQTHSCNTSAPPPSPFTTSDYDSLVSNTSGIPESAWPDLHGMLTGDIPGSFDGPDFEDFSGPASVQGDPIHTTTLDQVTGNTTVSETIPTHNFSYSPSPLSITTTTTTTTNNYQNGSLVSTTTVTESPTVGEVQPLPEIPTDCDFMPTVCDFIDWVRDPFNEEEPDLSQFINDEDFEREFNVSGNATCPAPMVIITSKGGYEFSWEPACQWAGLVKPFIIIGALILAIMINLGSFRRD